MALGQGAMAILGAIFHALDIRATRRRLDRLQREDEARKEGRLSPSIFPIQRIPAVLLAGALLSLCSGAAMADTYRASVIATTDAQGNPVLVLPPDSPLLDRTTGPVFGEAETPACFTPTLYTLPSRLCEVIAQEAPWVAWALLGAALLAAVLLWCSSLSIVRNVGYDAGYQAGLHDEATARTHCITDEIL